MFISRVADGGRVTLHTMDGPITIIVNNDMGPNQMKLTMDLPKSVLVDVERPLPLKTSSTGKRTKIL